VVAQDVEGAAILDHHGSLLDKIAMACPVAVHFRPDGLALPSHGNQLIDWSPG
jgi:hypothetical protein